MEGSQTRSSLKYAKANNSGIGEDFNESEPISHLKKFDVNSQYPTVMSRPLPVDGGEWVQLESSKKQRLKQLYALLEKVDYDAKDYDETYLVKVSYYVPCEAHDFIDWAPPARMSVLRS